MSKYQKFIFHDYHFDHASKTLSLFYTYDDQLEFIESYQFDFEFSDQLDSESLDIACQTLFLMAGVSYYKLYLAPQIVINPLTLDQASATFFAKTYQKGLGEFFYKNNLDPKMPIIFPSSPLQKCASKPISSNGKLIAVGGGKDSLLSIEILRSQPELTIWSLGHKAQISPLMERVGLPNFLVSRHLDPSITEHNQRGAYSGHIPISAIFAAVGTVIAVLGNKKDIVMSNESSASDPSLNYREVSINHQYSKSLEFEIDFQHYLAAHFGDSVRYYSLLRPLSELNIARLFAPYFDRYADVFSSCNRAFTQDSTHLFWCGECAKCAFAFLILTPFISRNKLEKLFHKNLLLDTSLDVTYRQLLGIEGDKPLDCVGEIKESRAAMQLAQKQYQELNKYQFSLPSDYDWKTLGPKSMPVDAYRSLMQFLLV